MSSVPDPEDVGKLTAQMKSIKLLWKQQDESYHEQWERRFWSNVREGDVDECWEWQQSRKNGYGQTSILGEDGQEILQAHRVAKWLQLKDDMKGVQKLPSIAHAQVNHYCHNRACCNPNHSYLSDQKENIADAIERGSFIPVNERGE